MPKRSPRSRPAPVSIPGAYRNPLYTRGVVYWYAYRGGPKIWSGTFEDEQTDAAAIAIAEGYAAARAKGPAPQTFASVVRAYQADRAWTGLAAATRKTNGVWLDRIEDRFGACSAAELTPRRVYAWLLEVEETHGVRARDRARDVLSRVCSWARSPARALLPSDCRPTDDIESAYRAPPQDAAPLPEVLDAIAKLRASGAHQIADALALALNTGLRRSDLCRVTWEAVERERGVIVWRPQKGARRGRVVVIPLRADLLTLLDRLGPSEGPILRTSRDTPWTPDGLSASIDAALRGLGYPWRLHALRRACATHLQAQGWRTHQIAAVLGWSDREADVMLATYADPLSSLVSTVPEAAKRQPDKHQRGLGGR